MKYLKLLSNMIVNQNTVIHNCGRDENYIVFEFFYDHNLQR